MNLISIEEAAEILGYSVKGLRKIVARSKAKAQGARVRGPTIRFFQTTKGAPLRFKVEWIEEFIDPHTINPQPHSAPQRRPTSQSSRTLPTSGLDEQFYDVT